jgi:hypothetical protein
MKTLAKTLIAVILLMVSFQVFSANDKGAIAGSRMIIYQINIHITTDPSFFYGAHFFVVITDENGRLVAPPQLSNINKLIYTFSEAGPVKGTRVARLVLDPNTDILSDRIIVSPDAKTGVFVPGSVYIFNLWPATTRTR